MVGCDGPLAVREVNVPAFAGSFHCLSTHRAIELEAIVLAGWALGLAFPEIPLHGVL